jgi:hypothetical protein
LHRRAKTGIMFISGGEFRRIRNDELREVNNCAWIAATLEKMGSKVGPSHPHVVSAVEKYFSPWEIALAPDAQEVLKELKAGTKSVSSPTSLIAHSYTAA